MNYGKDWAIFAMCLRPMNAKTTTNTLVMENYRVQINCGVALGERDAVKYFLVKCIRQHHCTKEQLNFYIPDVLDDESKCTKNYKDLTVRSRHSPKKILCFIIRSRVSIFNRKYSIGRSPLILLHEPQSS